MDTQSQTRLMVKRFLADFLECWERLPNKSFFFGLLTAWLALFHFLGNATFGYLNTPSLLRWMYLAYSSGGGDDAHGKLIPFVVVGLFWWKRKELLLLPLRTWWPGLLLVVAALGLHIASYLGQQPKASIIALFVGIYGLMGLAWGPTWLRAGFLPFCLFAFCVPIGSLGEFVTFPLRLLVTAISVGFSNVVLGIDVVRDGSQIFDAQRSFQYDVAPACSGIRSLISLLALTAVYGFVSFKAGWKRLLMVTLAVPLAVIGNAVRITGVILVAEAFGQDAGSWFEQKFGFVTFAIAIACMLLLGRWLRENEVGPALLPEAKPI